MIPQKFTTEGTEKKNFRFFKSSISAVFLVTFLYLNLLSVFSVVNF